MTETEMMETEQDEQMWQSDATCGCGEDDCDCECGGEESYCTCLIDWNSSK